MATWRDRGYVPDSDDEGEGEEESQRVEGMPGGGVPSNSKLNLEIPLIREEIVTLDMTRDDDEDCLEVECYPEAVSATAPDVSRSSPQKQLTKELAHTKPGSAEQSKETAVETSSLNLGRSSQSSDVLSTPPTSLSTPSGSFPAEHTRSMQNSSTVQVVISKTPDPYKPTKKKPAARVALDPVPAPRLSHTLRKRNPIQLHPYLLESERYRQTLKARGIKPVRVEEPESQEAGEAADSDSQDQEFEFDDDSQPNIVAGSPSASSPQLQDAAASNISARTGSASPVGHLSTAPAVDDDDEFPDVSTLVRRKSTGVIYSGYKRRKTDHTSVKEATSRLSAVLRSVELNAAPTRTGLAGAQSVQSANLTESRSGMNIFDVPSSPSHSVRSEPSTPTSPKTPGFRFPRGFSMQSGKTTPVSAITTREPVAEISDDSDSGPRPYRRRTKTSNNTSRSSSIASGEDDFAQLRTVQRKIRGVLPASWLRLDQQNQTYGSDFQSRKARQHQIPSSTRDVARPGVARRKSFSKSRSTSVTTDTVQIDISDDSEGSPPKENPNGPYDVPLGQPDARQRIGGNPAIPEFWEVEKDNRVDAMLPSAGISRKNYSKKLHNKRQRRHETTVEGLPRSLLSKSIGSRRSRQPKITEHLSKRPSMRKETRVPRKRTVPKLSILDAPKPGGVFPGSTPRFLRIANRQARSRRDKARHSPSKKIIKLHTWRDTEEVQNVLRDWREGTILPVADPPLPPISPGLRPQGRSGGDIEPRQRTLPVPVPKLPMIVSLDQDEREGMRPRSKFLKPIVRQTRLPLISITPSARVPATVRGRIPHQPRSLAQANTILRASRPSFDKSRSVPRPAQLEILESELPSRHRRAAFHNDLSLLDRLYEQQRMVSSRELNLPLERFLTNIGDEGPAGVPVSNRRMEKEKVTQRPFSSRKPRKRTPKRLDFKSIEYLPPGDPTLVQEGNVIPVRGTDASIVLTGLSSYGTSYTSNFGVIPLPVGTYFHESTFVGCGDFSKALRTAAKRDYNLNVGSTTFNSPERSLRWGVWNDTVSSELAFEFEWIAQTLEQLWHSRGVSRDDRDLNLPLASQVTRLVTFVISYLADFLSFADPIDRKSFVRRSTQVLRSFWERLSLALPQANQALDCLAKVVTQTASLAAIISYQVLRIAQSGIVEPSINAEANELLRLAAQGLIRTLRFYGIKHVRSFYEDNQRISKRENGIRDDNFLIEAWVTAIQTFSQPVLENDMFWSVFNEQLGQEKLKIAANVQVFEQMWMEVMSIIPLFEFDEYGVFEVGRRFKTLDDNWKLIKGVVSRTLAIYKSNPSKQPATANEYLRVVFSRCHHLITGWGWKKCESIIGVLFDFFAANGLAHLYKEESSSTPNFLERLDQEQSPEIEPGDKCFHILLKVIAVGLKAMSKLYPNRKIRNITFRLMPNHGRQYPKEEAVRCEDLESLRNHHNLLCTLYWASPPSSRPSVNAIRDLVDLETSHREACHISLRAWSNLMTFQLSTIEPAASLQPFIAWHSGITSQMVRQHGLARTEAQAQFAVVSSGVGTAVMPSLLEMIISQNQQQVEAILADALLTIKNAMLRAKRTDLSMALLAKASTVDVFHMFDAQKIRQNRVVSQAVAIVQEYVKICSRSAKSGGSPQGNEDSQDFGDWSVFEDLVSREDSKEAAQHLSNVVYESLVRLVSNCFGSDVVPDEAFLITIVDTWASVAQFLVKEGLKQWNNFIGTYGWESWSSLRSTEQTRKFTAYFMSKVMETDITSYEANKSFFLSFWMSSLVERESMLKFQHRFTNVLLNQDRENPLLKNLPFWVSHEANGYAITAVEFRERRLSLISCVLANMRDSIQEIGHYSSAEATSARHDYVELLKSLMSSMKTNYEELRQGSSYHGSYVEFVQKIVESLQQHTADICPIDKFFTDSSAFPLPAADPTYVVGRLKHFAPKLAEKKMHKHFASFLLSVSDRAAAEHQQAYLSGQIYTAMSDTFESGDVRRPSLRAFLIQAIFPAYIEVAMDSTTGWIFARPLLQALNRMFDSFLTDIDSSNSACVESALSTLEHTLDSFRNSADLVIPQSGLLEQPTVLNTLASFYCSISSMLNPIDYLCRRSGQGHHAMRCIAFFSALATFISNLLEGHQDEAVSPYVDAPDFPALPPLFPELRQYCSQELRAALKSKWSRRGDDYFVVLRGLPVQVEVEIGSLEEEREGLLGAIKEYRGLIREMGFLQNRPPSRRNKGMQMLGDLLL